LEHSRKYAKRSVPIVGDKRDYRRIHGVMVFPEDTWMRASYLQHLIAKKWLPADEPLPDVNSAKLAKWPAIQNAAHRSIALGLLAGDYLIFLVSMRRLANAEPSGRRASQAVERWWKSRAYGDGAPPRATSRKIENKAFAHHRASAHLWAAHNILIGKHGRTVAAREMTTRKGTQVFLEFAALFEQHGRRLVTPRTRAEGRRYLLDVQHLWRLPPEVTPAKFEDMPPIKDEMLEILRTYSPY